MYRKIRIYNRKSKEFGRKSYRKALYRNYSHLGKKKKGHGNLLSYVLRAQEIFDKESSTVNLMETQVKNIEEILMPDYKKQNDKYNSSFVLNIGY